MNVNFNEVTTLIKNSKFTEAVNLLNTSKDAEKKSPNYFFLKGICYLYLNEFNQAVDNFSLAININNKNPKLYFYRGYSYSRLNEYQKTKNDYKKAISLNPNVAEFYNNIAQTYRLTGENDDAIKNFITSIELNKKSKQSFEGLLSILSQTTDVNINTSKIVLAHKNLNKINFNYSPNEFIKDSDIKKLFDSINGVLDKNIENFKFEIIQTYRETQQTPNCNRHKKIFNTAEIIPQHCFGCYKVQFNIDTVIDLIKLYIVFDRLNLQNDNSRKCMIELRPGIPGQYKGLIFCNSIDESESILKDLSLILYKNFNKNIDCKIKRGCSEYNVKYPKYDDLTNDAMKYDPNWKEFEQEFDKKNPDMIFDKKFNSTIKGITLFDALVFRNWLAFAKMIGDDTYKLVTDQVFYSKFIEEKLKLKLKTN